MTSTGVNSCEATNLRVPMNHELERVFGSQQLHHQAYQRLPLLGETVGRFAWGGTTSPEWARVDPFGDP